MGEQAAARAIRFTSAGEATAPQRGRRVRRRRVLIADARANGRYLRTTWHAEDRMFVLSTWTGEVCTGAVRIPVDKAPDLVNLLTDGLGDAVNAAAAPAQGPKTSTRQQLDELKERVGSFTRWLRGLSRS